MARQPETRLQVSARRFSTRRMAHALVRRDVAMHDDPLRAHSLAFVAGCVLAAVAVAACTGLALVRPRGLPATAPIVMASESGALYVRVGDTLHPVLNLASARLVARAAANPVPASEGTIAGARRGPLLGIPGAPATIGHPVPARTWTVCDDERTTVAVGTAEPEGVDARMSVLVSARGESAATTYLLYDGHRAAVDLRSAAVVRALRLDGVVPIAVSRTLLDLVPEAPAITTPRVAGAGTVGPAALGGAPIGTVVRVQRADTPQHYVVLRDGVQAVGEVAADLIRFTYDRGAAPVSTVAPAAIAALPIATGLPVTTFPERAHRPVGRGDGETVCARWGSDASKASSNTVVLSGKSAGSSDWEATVLAQADGDGPNVDAVAIPGDTYVRSARIAGGDDTAGTRFLVSDRGVLFGVHDDDAATFLGLGQSPGAAPWPVLARLPRGPELSTDAASVLRDGLPAPS